MTEDTRAYNNDSEKRNRRKIQVKYLGAESIHLGALASYTCLPWSMVG